jgi:hypothetical protein
MAMEQRSGASGAALREIRLASASLRETLTRVRQDLPELAGIGVCVSEPVDEGGSTPGTAQMVITITADTQEHVDEHGMQLQDQGCSCVSVAAPPGVFIAECTCPD